MEDDFEIPSVPMEPDAKSAGMDVSSASTEGERSVIGASGGLLEEAPLSM